LQGEGAERTKTQDLRGTRVPFTILLRFSYVVTTFSSEDTAEDYNPTEKSLIAPEFCTAFYATVLY